MHPAIQSGPVGIYARFSSTLQSQSSIEDQVRRCREFIAVAGGDAPKAHVFADRAISGASMERPGFEELMTAVTAGRIKAIVTEDMSRISRDFADSALIFKRLQFAQVPLLGVADGIDTSAKHAKLSFTVKSLVADLYLDDLRDKTLRGLEGRALAGFATGGVPYGFHTMPVTDAQGRTIGNRIEIHEAEAQVIRRIFEDSREGKSLSAIALALNREGVPSPRAGSRHKTFGWGASSIRAMLYNERYVGVWRFKERQWVKVPGTNKRTPKARDASEVMTQERLELRIIDAAVWHEVHVRLAAVHRRYTQNKPVAGVVRRKTPYLLSGLLVCDACSSPMSISAGSSAAYYRCQTNRTKGTCESRISVREEVVRKRILDAIRERLMSPDGIAHVRKRIAEELRDYSRKLEAELADRRERLARTEDKIRGLVEFIATGDRSDYVTSTLRDLEAFVRSEKVAIEGLVRESQQPLRLPSVDEIVAQATDLNARLTADPEAGRAQLRAWLREGQIRIGIGPEGAWVASGALLPLVILDRGSRNVANPKKEQRGIPTRESALFTRCSGGSICPDIYRVSLRSLTASGV